MEELGSLEDLREVKLTETASARIRETFRTGGAEVFRALTPWGAVCVIVPAHGDEDSAFAAAAAYLAEAPGGVVPEDGPPEDPA